LFTARIVLVDEPLSSLDIREKIGDQEIYQKVS